MPKIYYESDAELSFLKGRKVGILGYGSQGRAHALNLRDSGIDVCVGVRFGGKSWNQAKADGFDPLPLDEASKRSDVIMMLTPDTTHREVYESAVKQNLSRGKALGFAHGYSIRFGEVSPPRDIDVFMVAPKGPGPTVRQAYLNGFGVPALLAVERNYTGQAEKLALAYAKALGATRAGVLATSFSEEAETDLFGEQSVLVGGVMSLIEKGFEVLVEEGYQPELAYFEVCNELKLIMDLIYTGGFKGMLNAVSDTAKYGGLTRGNRVVDENVKSNMKKVLREIKSGEFAKEWTGNRDQSSKTLRQMMGQLESKQIEAVGSVIRRMAGIEQSKEHTEG
ncbi:MAG: ketol-acid reductoisomerase [Thermoprotei archaeon]